jgi:hypothetical protein
MELYKRAQSYKIDGQQHSTGFGSDFGEKSRMLDDEPERARFVPFYITGGGGICLSRQPQNTSTLLKKTWSHAKAHTRAVC